ncbi:acetoacetyl-CoA synthetase [Alteromonadaceae bacterium Bs31]|nr:acetoacetyl-CoA synthetase [Alteromonadaceae bacterium Bs31]
MLWQASEERKQRSHMQRFLEYIHARHPLCELSYAALHQLSVQQPAFFWTELIRYFEVDFEGDVAPAATDFGFERYAWFPNVKLNFAKNLLKTGEPSQTALISVLENGDRQVLSFAELRQAVACFQQQIAATISENDVLACYMPNISETVIAMLATTASGGIFTSTSADFGVEGVVDRFGQSQAKVLVCCAGYEYNGKYFDCLAKVREILERIDSIEKVVVVDRYHKKPDISQLANAEFWQAPSEGELAISYCMRSFSAPLYIMYSSGTTGKPKCIVHAAGGVLLQHIKELGLHSDHNSNKNIFFFTTCGWMMWNWLVSSLFFGGTCTLYEGSPAYPSFEKFLSLIETEKINIFGTSPKYLKALEDSKTEIRSIDFSALETILSTGAPLLPEQYDFVYNSIKSDVLLASISGGTDIIGCFFLGNPLLPVYRGELQCVGLGMDVACIDESGQALIGQQGELVCRSSFPSRPLYFLNDPDNTKIKEAYFSTYPGLWYHGDYIKINSRGGAIFYGRSDATLNPGGVRIGTSEIYRQTETLDYIEDSVCVGRQRKGEVDVILFVKMKPKELLSEQRIHEIKQGIKVKTTSRHVPRDVIAVADIPYTRSGKKIELAVSKIINGKKITNKEAIANPECLAEYKKIVEHI